MDGWMDDVGGWRGYFLRSAELKGNVFLAFICTYFFSSPWDSRLPKRLLASPSQSGTRHPP